MWVQGESLFIFMILEERMQHYLKYMAAVSLAISCQVAQAGVIVRATTVSAWNADFGGAYVLVNQINQLGLSAGYIAGVVPFGYFLGYKRQKATRQQAKGNVTSIR